MPRFSLAFLFFGCLNASLAQAEGNWSTIISSATAKHLPEKILNEIVASGARVNIRQTSDGPHYIPGPFGGGTIYLPFADSPSAQWTRGDWSNFYNEAFSAWWGNVFVRDGRYAQDRGALLNDASLTAKYREAHPTDPRLAQEEGYSETAASIIIIGYPRIRLDPDTGNYVLVPTPYEQLYFSINRTVSAVSHSDRPGYTPAAEDTYPDQREYGCLMRWLFDREAPPIP